MALPQHIDPRQLSHAYILSAASREEALSAAREIAAAALCSGENPPCGHCRDCRKVAQGIHPDLITVRRLEDDKGKPRQEITVDQIRGMAADAIVLPNEAQRKVYLLPEAETMNLPAQNAALKLLEEPPAGVVFLLCAENAQALLPTVRSRCALLHCTAQAQADDGESRKHARAYVQAAASGSLAELYRWCAGQEGMDNRAASAFIEALTALLADMLCAREEDPGLGQDGLKRLLRLAERCAACLQVNVGVKHIFGLLAVDAIDSDRNRG